MFGSKLAQIHLGKQSLDKIQTRKVKALKKTKIGNKRANSESTENASDTVKRNRTE